MYAKAAPRVLNADLRRMLALIQVLEFRHRHLRQFLAVHLVRHAALAEHLMLSLVNMSPAAGFSDMQAHQRARLTRSYMAAPRRQRQSVEQYRTLSKRYGINQKTGAKWKKHTSVAVLPTGPKEPRTTVLSVEEEAVIVAFRKHTLLPLDDCLYALQPTIPHLTRSSLHRCLHRHDISRLPDVEGDKPAKKRNSNPTRLAIFTSISPRCRSPEGKLYLFVASTAHRSSPLSSCTRRQARWRPLSSYAIWSTSSTPC